MVEGKTINLGKSRVEGQAETFHAESQVEALIPRLRRENARGFDVYITPIDPKAHYLVIDDMQAGAVQLLAGLGYQPCLVQSSSAGNEQAVLKIPKVDRPDEQQLANKLVQRLNQEHGDPRFSGVVHPFRMAGFSNKKPDKGSAFTRLIEAMPRLCVKAGAMLQQIRQAADDVLAKRKRQAEQERIEADARRQAERSRDRAELDLQFERDDDAELAFRRAVAAVRAWVKLRGLVEDASRVDFRAAVAMLQAGWDEAAVRSGLHAGSDDLAQRHRDVEGYVRRTVFNAGVELATGTKRVSAARPRTPPKHER